MNIDDMIMIYDVVCEVGVLMVIVSCVVNGNKNVKENICKKVFEVIDCFDYCLNVVVCGLVSKKMIIVGVVIFNIVNSYFLILVCGIDDIVVMYKYNIVFVLSDEDDDKEVNVVNILFVK